MIYKAPMSIKNQGA